MAVHRNQKITGARQLSRYFRDKGKVMVSFEEYLSNTDIPIAPNVIKKYYKAYSFAIEWVLNIDPNIFIDLEPKPTPKAAPKPKPAPKVKAKKDD
tara:strand:+ start:1050 stop:1334 length:285 start_codon:yes stop_codon:yes gene_type:complete